MAAQRKDTPGKKAATVRLPEELWAALQPAPLRFWLDHPRGGRVLYDDDDLRLTLDDVRVNVVVLRRHGVYEKALLSAFTGTNHATWRLSALVRLFKQADRGRLRAAGDPLPGAGPFTVYRGVAGPTHERRINGLSWTGSIEHARWFAQEHARRLADRLTDPNPGVYRVTIPERAVLAYTNTEGEGEFIVILPRMFKPTRVE